MHWWNLFDQLRQLECAHPPERPHIHMPESLCFPNQAGPGANLLPSAKPTAKRTMLGVDGSSHAITLI